MACASSSGGEILRKLKASGAKVLTGPRGTGKTTLMLRAKNQMMKGASDVLPAYVNFKTSLRLEPLYRGSANATFWFRQWLLLRTLTGVAESAENLGANFPWSSVSPGGKEAILRCIDALQAGSIESASELIPQALTVADLNGIVKSILKDTGRHRAVLLFDDAAHAFSSEQQRDFFDFFRDIKSSWVSPKAAIYPGVTDFSASFHLGHDAEEVDVWLDPSDANYFEFMTSLLHRRLPASSFERFESDGDAFKALALAAFGVPRNLLNMVREVLEGSSQRDRRLAISRTAIQKAVANCGTISLQIFKSLKKKLPIYSKFIDAGELLLTRGTAVIKDFNGLTTRSHTTTIALQHPIPAELRTLVAFLQYGGLVRPRSDAKRGQIGTFWVLDIHYALLIEANAIVARRSAGLNDVVESLLHRDPHAFARITPTKLLGTQDISGALPLMLPPCARCQTERITPSAKFCLNCGAELPVSSTFETAVNQDIAVLPLTNSRATSIKAQSSIKTVKDVLLDKDHSELLKVRMIGPFWATRISRYAEEFVE